MNNNNKNKIQINPATLIAAILFSAILAYFFLFNNKEEIKQENSSDVQEVHNDDSTHESVEEAVESEESVDPASH